jgi:hypothetical protein
MPRSSTLARNVRIAFGLSLVVGGLLHGSGYGAVVPLVQDVGNDAKVIFPALWVGYAWHYLMLIATLGVVAASLLRERSPA